MLTHQSSDDSMDEEMKPTTPPDKPKEPGLESLEDLVDQMEIQISDHDDEQATQQKVGVASKEEESEEVKDRDKVEGQQKKRMRRMSTFERVEFRPISLEHQLCDDDIIDLMQLLQVCFN